MSILLANVDGNVVFWGAITAICVIPAACHYAFRAWKLHQEIGLKHEMIARGMSADEIERVLTAGGRREAASAESSE